MRLPACLFPSLFQSIKNEWARQWRIRWRKNKKQNNGINNKNQISAVRDKPTLNPCNCIHEKPLLRLWAVRHFSLALFISFSLTHNVVTLYKIQLCLNILFWLTENYIVLPVSLTVYQPCFYVYPLFQDLFFSAFFFFHDRNVSNGWVILSGAGCLSGVLLYISMTRPSLPAARHSYEFQPHSHILQTRAKHRWVAVEERYRQRKRQCERKRETRMAPFITIPTTHTHTNRQLQISPTARQIRIDNILCERRKWQAIKTFNGPFPNNSQELAEQSCCEILWAKHVYCQ